MITKSSERDAVAKVIVVLTQAFLFLAVTGCGPSSDDRYQSGFSDGYAEGYNTTLQIRATLVEGDWKDKNYSKGYQDGRADGVRAALEARKKSQR
jgi:flagellar biosynthesis/type III secretory pathway protein FliH